MNPAKKICSTIVALVLVFCAMPFSQAQAANDPETLFYVEDLGNGITASGWSYTNHKITTTNVSSSSGGTATLTATLKDFPINVPVRLSLHCAPNGAITRG